MPRERELKLETEADSVPRVLQWLQKRGATAKSARQLVTVYFDTPDFALRRAGISLRIRKSGNRYTQTVKQFGARAAGVFDRPEWESTVDGFLPDLRAARKTGLKFFRRRGLAAELQPAFEVRTQRTDYDFSRSPAIAISIDRGQVIAGKRRVRFCEIEIESSGDSFDAAFALARALARVAPIRMGMMAKSDRGYALLQAPDSNVHRAREPRLKKTMTIAEAFQTIGSECLRQITANVPGAVEGTVESLHQLRVGLRRLRAAISLFRAIVQDPQTQQLKRELQWANRSLGPARDLDVLLGLEIPAQIRRGLAAKRRHAQTEVAAALRSPRFHRLLLDLAEWMECGSWRTHDDSVEQSAVLYAIAELSRRHKKLARQLTKLPVLDPEQRHELRIRAKRLRYGVEFFGPLFTGRKNMHRRHQFLSPLKQLQDELGILNDIAMQQRVVAGLNGRVTAIPDNADVQSHLDSTIAAARKIAKAKLFWQ